MRAARRIADALKAPLIALHVEQPGAPDAGDIAPALRLAEGFGAVAETVVATGLPTAILREARARNVTHLVIGRGRPTLWRRLTGTTLSATVLRRAGDVTLHLVSDPAEPRRALPDLDGQALLPKLRAFCSALVIVLSAREREEEKIAALDSGADDYVEKPFALGELPARLRAALRRAGRAVDAAQSVLRIGPLEVDIAARIARAGVGEPLKLTPRERDLLVALAHGGVGRVITQRQLLATVWGPAHVEERLGKDGLRPINPPRHAECLSPLPRSPAAEPPRRFAHRLLPWCFREHLQRALAEKRFC